MESQPVGGDRLKEIIQIRNLLKADMKQISKLSQGQKGKVKAHKSMDEKVRLSKPRIRYYYCNFYKTAIPKGINIVYEEAIDQEVRGCI